jgi:glucose-6-phosphate 1-dehydrogenase
VREATSKTAWSDALVLFGVSGLAHKMIFPALYAMVKRGTLTVPVIGVAFLIGVWTPSQAGDRQHRAIRRGVDNKRALKHLLSLLTYVSGDYKTRAPSKPSSRRWHMRDDPAHYLAIPPALFETVIKGLGAAGLAKNARVIVEKPFGRDLASARELNRVAGGVSGGFDLPHRSLPGARRRS